MALLIRQLLIKMKIEVDSLDSEKRCHSSDRVLQLFTKQLHCRDLVSRSSTHEKKTSIYKPNFYSHPACDDKLKINRVLCHKLAIYFAEFCIRESLNSISATCKYDNIYKDEWAGIIN